MESKEHRDEVWKRNKQYMNVEEVVEDLMPFCKNCKLYKGESHDFETCRGQHCMEFWLSHEYKEWCMDAAYIY